MLNQKERVVGSEQLWNVLFSFFLGILVTDALLAFSFAEGPLIFILVYKKLYSNDTKPSKSCGREVPVLTWVNDNHFSIQYVLITCKSGLDGIASLTVHMQMTPVQLMHSQIEIPTTFR